MARSAGNRRATFCGSRERVTTPGDPVRGPRGPRLLGDWVMLCCASSCSGVNLQRLWISGEVCISRSMGSELRLRRRRSTLQFVLPAISSVYFGRMRTTKGPRSDPVALCRDARDLDRRLRRREHRRALSQHAGHQRCQYGLQRPQAPA